MNDEQSIRDELVQILAQKRIHTNESLGRQGADADAILASPVIRRIQAEAWDRCVGEMPIDPDWKNFYGDNNPYIERGETA